MNTALIKGDFSHVFNEELNQGIQDIQQSNNKTEIKEPSEDYEM
jgi:hypothetical protein